MNSSLSRVAPLCCTVAFFVLACGGSPTKRPLHSPEPSSEEFAETPPPPEEEEVSELPEDCQARTNSLSGKCFKSASDACTALNCTPPRTCSFGYSMPVVVSCGAP